MIHPFLSYEFRTYSKLKLLKVVFNIKTSRLQVKGSKKLEVSFAEFRKLRFSYIWGKSFLSKVLRFLADSSISYMVQSLVLGIPAHNTDKLAWLHPINGTVVLS